MQFVSTRDFRIRPREVWERAKQDDLVVTANGRPVAILTQLPEGDLEQAFVILRRMRAQMAVSRMRATAAENDAAQLDDETIDAEIAQARATVVR